MMNMSEKKFDPRKADKLLTKKRVDKLKPYELIDRLGVSESDAIADLGACNGFFTIPLAKVSKQDVYVVDIEPQMLDLLKYRVDQENLDHIQYVTSDLEDIALDEDIVDKIMVAFVIHEVTSIEKALSEIKRIMKPNAKVMFIEWEKVASDSGPPLDHRISSNELIKALETEGFSTEHITLNEDNYAVLAELK